MIPSTSLRPEGNLNPTGLAPDNLWELPEEMPTTSQCSVNLRLIEHSDHQQQQCSEFMVDFDELSQQRVTNVMSSQSRIFLEVTEGQPAIEHYFHQSWDSSAGGNLCPDSDG